jgi:hypothetical protein
MAKPAPREQIIRLITRYWFSRSVYIAAKLGHADTVGDCPKVIVEGE